MTEQVTDMKTTHGSVVVQALRRAGITRFYMYVAGSGDSGDVCCCDVFAGDDNPITVDSLTELVSYTYMGGQYEQRGMTFGFVQSLKEKTDMPLGAALIHLADNAIANSDVDWYNNEGGAGEYTLDVATGREKLVMSVNTLQEVFWSNEVYE